MPARSISGSSLCRAALAAAALHGACAARAEGTVSVEVGFVREDGTTSAIAGLSFGHTGQALGWDWSSSLAFGADGATGALEARRDLGGRTHVLSFGHVAFGGHPLLLPERPRVALRYGVEGERASASVFLSDPSLGPDGSGDGPFAGVTAAIAGPGGLSLGATVLAGRGPVTAWGTAQDARAVGLGAEWADPAGAHDLSVAVAWTQSSEADGHAMRFTGSHALGTFALDWRWSLHGAGFVTPGDPGAPAGLLAWDAALAGTVGRVDLSAAYARERTNPEDDPALDTLISERASLGLAAPLGEVSAALAAEWWRNELLHSPFLVPGEPTVSSGWDVSVGLDDDGPTLGWALGVAAGGERWGPEETRWRSVEAAVTIAASDSGSWSLTAARTRADDPWAGPVRETTLSAAYAHEWTDASASIGLEGWRSSLGAARRTLHMSGEYRLSERTTLVMDAEIGRETTGGQHEPIRRLGLSLRIDAPFRS